jgi:lysozyme
MTTTELASRLIHSFEGWRLTAYWDINGQVWTIGYGHTGDVHEGQSITPAQAVKFFEQDAHSLLQIVDDKSVLEGAALVSFGYNCGAEALMRVLRGDITVTSEGFLTQDGHLYGTSSKGTKLSGLIARRCLEAALIMTARGMK